MTISNSNFLVSQPVDVPHHTQVGSDYKAIGQVAGVGFNTPYPQASQVGTIISNTAGPSTTGSGAGSPLSGLGGPFVNPTGFAETTDPFSSGVNLTPSPIGIKGALDISRLDPRAWFPGVMSIFHTTRKPGAAAEGGPGAAGV